MYIELRSRLGCSSACFFKTEKNKGDLIEQAIFIKNPLAVDIFLKCLGTNIPLKSDFMGGIIDTYRIL